MSVTVVGLTETIARLGRAAVVGEVAATAGATVAKVEVTETAKSLAPVDTGALQASIAPTTEGVVVTVDYAAPVEYGTSDTPAQPFLRPAMDEADESVIARAAAVVMRGA